ncbi:hypothetical protein DFJ74DRAFT_767657 [Hyaloraphidium curvatum]|nr:hypothetical protein DFJ74DRAFT_767657 [Hyaloraphidium curvatum]
MSLKLSAFAEDALRTGKFCYVKRVRSLGLLGWLPGELKVLRALSRSNWLELLDLSFKFDSNEGIRSRIMSRRAVRAAWREIARLERADHLLDQYDSEDAEANQERKIAAARERRDRDIELSDHESEAGADVSAEDALSSWREREEVFNDSFRLARLPCTVQRLTLDLSLGSDLEVAALDNFMAHVSARTDLERIDMRSSCVHVPRGCVRGLNAKLGRLTIDADHFDDLVDSGLMPRELEIINGEIWEWRLGDFLEEPPSTSHIEDLALDLTRLSGVQRLILHRVPTVNLLKLPRGLKELDMLPSGEIEPKLILNVPIKRLKDLKRSLRQARLERLFFEGLDWDRDHETDEEDAAWKEIVAEHGERFRKGDD